MESRGREVAVLNAALLHRMALDVLCDNVCFIQTPLCVRYRRAVVRDGATLASFVQRIRSQKDIKPNLMHGADSVYVMKNSRDMHLFIDKSIVFALL